MKTKQSIIISTLTLIVSLFLASHTSALTYQSDTNVDFTINPTISMTVSGDLIIDNLTPGSSSDSNIIEVGVSTNASHGYYLSATVGSSNTDTNLTNSENSNYKFSNLSSNASSLSNFSDNEWGYSYSTDGGTNWISGSQGSTSSGYNGLPLDGNDSGATGITLVDTTTPLATNQVKFKIGAKASNTQASGTYTNTINFYAITHQAPLTFDDAFAAADKTKYLGYYTMQDMTTSICQTVEQDFTTKLIDVRDNQTYFVGKAKDDNCWMLQNLKLGKKTDTLTLDNTTSDVDNNGFTLDGKLLDGHFTYETVDGVELQNNNSQYYCTDSYGCYYNWYTATAGSGTTYVEEGDVNYSICPSNWNLPTMNQFDRLRSWYNNSTSLMLVDNPTTNTENTIGKIPGFLLSGYYSSNGASKINEQGQYWFRTVYTKRFSYGIRLDISEISNTYSSKYTGVPIRCLTK